MLLRRPAPARLFILAEPRSGSTWLLRTLGSHPEVALAGELLNHVLAPTMSRFQGAAPGEFPACLAELERGLPVGRRLTGCKVLLNQLTFISEDFPAAFVRHFLPASFILLTRGNPVAAEVSLALAHAHDRWHCWQESEVELRRVQIEPRGFCARIAAARSRRERVGGLLATLGCRHHLISYEELFADPRRCVGKICAFLGLDPAPIRFSDERRGNPFPPSQVVGNYRELVAHLTACEPELLAALQALEPLDRDGPAGSRRAPASGQ
ncbi:MAG: sulfotransferase [Acidobacteriota bacterium]